MTPALLLAAGLLACGAKTKKTTYVDPDAYGQVEGTGIEARDVRTVARQMAEELLASPALAGRASPPRIAVAPVKNRSRFLIDQEIFTTLITDLLVQNAAGKLAILNNQMNADADFLLEGELRSLSANDGEAQSDYVVVRFQLTDKGSGVVTWSNSYEMKKEGSWGVMYQ